MMEIRTAEEYVVSELLEAKEEISKLTFDLNCEQDSYERLLSKYNALRSLIAHRITPYINNDGHKIISFGDSVWEKFDNEEYNSWVSFFPDAFVESGDVEGKETE